MRIVPSLEPETILSPSRLNVTEHTASLCPFSFRSIADCRPTRAAHSGLYLQNNNRLSDRDQLLVFRGESMEIMIVPVAAEILIISSYHSTLIYEAALALTPSAGNTSPAPEPGRAAARDMRMPSVSNQLNGPGPG